mmetsp:Transcript_14547/g.41330  ORF Transcript_14547/g.41330 Transcript_14547/m.41330 type:complete len:317 (+) Transcript_14547:228-1178(+)
MEDPRLGPGARFPCEGSTNSTEWALRVNAEPPAFPSPVRASSWWWSSCSLLPWKRWPAVAFLTKLPGPCLKDPLLLPSCSTYKCGARSRSGSSMVLSTWESMTDLVFRDANEGRLTVRGDCDRRVPSTLAADSSMSISITVSEVSTPLAPSSSFARGRKCLRALADERPRRSGTRSAASSVVNERAWRASTGPCDSSSGSSTSTDSSVVVLLRSTEPPDRPKVRERDWAQFFPTREIRDFTVRTRAALSSGRSRSYVSTFGTSGRIRNCPQLDSCSFSTRKKFHTNRRNTSATAKIVRNNTLEKVTPSPSGENVNA